MQQAIFIMGVSGCGKTTIGEGLSARTGFPFYDADNFHPKENVEKMRAGTPLTDEDRRPWLENIHRFVKEKIESQDIIVVCSALKKVYREILSQGIEIHCKWILLDGDYDTVLQRLKERTGHFMPATLLRSQFDALETPADAIAIDIRQTPDKMIDLILSKMEEPTS